MVSRLGIHGGPTKSSVPWSTDTPDPPAQDAKFEVCRGGTLCGHFRRKSRRTVRNVVAWPNGNERMGDCCTVRIGHLHSVAARRGNIRDSRPQLFVRRRRTADVSRERRPPTTDRRSGHFDPAWAGVRLHVHERAPDHPETRLGFDRDGRSISSLCSRGWHRGCPGDRSSASPRGCPGSRCRESRKLTYKEWDVNPKVETVPRGGQRLVTGPGNGSAYCTPDHYETFGGMR